MASLRSASFPSQVAITTNGFPIRLRAFVAVVNKRYDKMLQPVWLAALIFFPICNSIDTITSFQSLRDGETIMSAGENFVLGFFSPGNSTNRYVGIWYRKTSDQTVVWTANGENPVRTSSGVLTIDGGNMVLLEGGQNSNITLWSTNVSSSTMANESSATLKDDGNLVLTDDHGVILWESFDYPTNTFLPGMKVGLNLRTGLKQILTSWKSEDDAAPGEYSLGIDPAGVPQYIFRKGSDTIWRSGPWNGERLSGVPLMNRDADADSWIYVANDNEIYLTFKYNSSITMAIVLHHSGLLNRMTWNDKNRRWNPIWLATQDRCDGYATCGAYGSCDSSRLVECECLRGFEPKKNSDWNLRDWSGGCVRKRLLDCDGKGDGFLRLANVKVPDTSRSRAEPGLSLEGCKEECLKNCSCTAYASADIREGGHGCLMWDGDLVDLRVYSDGGQDVYTRVAASELDGSTNEKSGGLQGKKKLLVTLLTIILGLLLISFCGYCWWRKAKGCEMNERCDVVLNDNDIEENGESGLTLFNVSVIAAATNNFSESNVLGKGGFGPVYKGQLLNGQEIAVKRLSKNSAQGTKEFKNEVTLIAKLQHRNLVRLLGYSINGQEKILIYEYMRNKSLDSFIFDQKRCSMLDWRKRFSIIAGIARGVLYLHEDSRLKVIHRDLKVSNILLDDDLNPKISDFGLARIFRQNQAQGKTNRVVGTYGYMSPEYAMDGHFSVKSDAFSFGVILLEITTGKRSSRYCDCCSMNLIGHVWEKWKEGRAMEVVDSSMIDISSFESEVLRCIQIGLLCVQEKAKDRPNMSSVVLMLGNETVMPSPTQPAFCFEKGNCSDHPIVSCSINELTLTKMEARE